MFTIPISAARLIRGAALLALCSAAAAQVELPLRQAAERRKPDFAPARVGQNVKVRGSVATRTVHILEQYVHLGIERDGYGLMLEIPEGDPRLDRLTQGDDIEAAGRIAARGGLPVLVVEEVLVLGHGKAPPAQPVAMEELQGFRHLGRLVVTSGRVVEMGENIAGFYILIGTESNPYKLFLAAAPGHREAGFGGLAVGDTIRALGIASQYCPSAPYNRWFQLTLMHPGDVVRTDRGLPISPRLLLALVIAVALAGLLFLRRERRLRMQREMLRRAYQLGEDVLGAGSPANVAARITGALPAIFRVSRARLYLHNLGAHTLERVPASADEEPLSITLAAPPGGVEAAVAACFQNRRLLAVPDMSRSPFARPQDVSGALPRACLFVPMISQGDVVGVYELDQNDRLRIFNSDEQALAQHLGNQIGVALKLLDQRSVREQLFRTEKLAAVGRLVSGVVNELQAPLASIRTLCDHAAASYHHGRQLEQLGHDVEAIGQEAAKAGDIVSRLVAFAGAEQVEARPVDLNLLVRNLAEFRERDWKSRGIRVHALISDEPLSILGSQGQLEQMLLALMVHTEQCLAESADKLIHIRTTRLARHALVEISYSGPRGGPDPFANAGDGAASTLGLGVCRSVVAGHGGELRAVVTADADPRFEIELPLAGRDRQSPQPAEIRSRDLGRTVTALVIEPDDAVERHLLTLLSGRGYRVIPVRDADVGLDLAQRLRFEAVFCSVRAPGLNWVELSERLQAHTDGFVLISDGYDPELAADFEGEGRFVLPKPIDENTFARILERVENLLKSRAFVG